MLNTFGYLAACPCSNIVVTNWFDKYILILCRLGRNDAHKASKINGFSRFSMRFQ